MANFRHMRVDPGLSSLFQGSYKEGRFENRVGEKGLVFFGRGDSTSEPLIASYYPCFQSSGCAAE